MRICYKYPPKRGARTRLVRGDGGGAPCDRVLTFDDICMLTDRLRCVMGEPKIAA